MRHATPLAIIYLVFAVTISPVPATPKKTHIPHMALLVDVSGSMWGQHAKAVAEAIKIAEFSTDDGRLCVWSFDDSPHCWKEGWVCTPDPRALEKARVWLSEQKPDLGTQVIPALRKVLSSKRSPLYVVLVTDAEFDETLDEINKAVEVAQGKREKPASISIISLCESKPGLKALAERWHGEYRAVPPKPEAPFDWGW